MTEKKVTEASNDFYVEFKAEYQAINLEIQQSKDQPKSNLTLHFNTILQRINNLEKSLTKATEYIPSYDERQYFLQLKELTQNLEAVKTELTPKAKFSFKSRKKKNSDKEEVPEKTATTASSTTEATERDVLSEATVLLKDRDNALLLLKDNQNNNVREKSVDVLLSNIKNSVILLEDADVQISAIHVKQLENCVIYCGQIEGSVLIYGMRNCTLFVGCHQLRMHEAHNVNMMLHVTSRPIIEDSNQIKVGAWNINASTNYYDQLEDFNWLKKVASPNWAVLDQGQQKVLVELIKENKDHDTIMSKRSLLLPS